MIREIQRQLMTIYRDRDSGFLITDEENIIHLNGGAAKILNTADVKRIDDALNFHLAKSIRDCITSRNGYTEKDVLIGNESYDIAVISLGGSAFVFLYKKDDGDKFRDKATLKAKIIDAMTAYQRTIFDTAKMFLINKIDDSEKYVERATARALKVNTAMSEFASAIAGKNCENELCNLQMLMENAVSNASEVLENTVALKLNIDENKTAFCNKSALEKAIYSAFSALLYGRKGGEIQIECKSLNGRDVISHCGVNLSFSQEVKDYIYGKRTGSLEQDMHTFGYDILRASNLMDMQGGELMVNSGENAEIYLILPENCATINGVLKSKEEKYLEKEDAFVILSDIL